jgi:hypothetical protein
MTGCPARYVMVWYGMIVDDSGLILSFNFIYAKRRASWLESSHRSNMYKLRLYEFTVIRIADCWVVRIRTSTRLIKIETLVKVMV